FTEDARKNAHRLQMQAKWLKERMEKLRQTCDEFQERLKQYEEDRAVQALMNVSKAASEGDKTAKFVMEQIMNFDKARPAWQEPTLRECVLWKATSCKGYDHVRARKLLKLPCRSTLQ
ncbi:hypothetical protein HPB47_009874, partial [Ixodes persulcatus]